MSIDTLPRDLIVEIFIHLKATECKRISCCNRALAETSKHIVIKRLIKRKLAKTRIDKLFTRHSLPSTTIKDLFIESYLKVNVRNIAREAILKNDEELLDELMERSYPFSLQYLLIDLFNLIINSKNVIINKFLSCSDIDPSIRENNLLVQVVKHGKTAVVKRLLQHPKIDPTVPNNLAIKLAMTDKQYRTVQVLYANMRIYSSLTPEYRSYIETKLVKHQKLLM